MSIPQLSMALTCSFLVDSKTALEGTPLFNLISNKNAGHNLKLSQKHVLKREQATQQSCTKAKCMYSEVKMKITRSSRTSGALILRLANGINYQATTAF